MFIGISGDSPESPFFVLRYLFATILLNAFRTASQSFGLACSPDHKDISQTLIKDSLRGDPGVGASYNDGKGMLAPSRAFGGG